MFTVPFDSWRLLRSLSSIEPRVSTECAWIHHPTSGVVVKFSFIRLNVALGQNHATFDTVPDFFVLH